MGYCDHCEKGAHLHKAVFGLLLYELRRHLSPLAHRAPSSCLLLLLVQHRVDEAGDTRDAYDKEDARDDPGEFVREKVTVERRVVHERLHGSLEGRWVEGRYWGA